MYKTDVMVVKTFAEEIWKSAKSSPRAFLVKKSRHFLSLYLNLQFHLSQQGGVSNFFTASLEDKLFWLQTVLKGDQDLI